jgi:hypothetical protein
MAAHFIFFSSSISFSSYRVVLSLSSTSSSSTLRAPRNAKKHSPLSSSSSSASPFTSRREKERGDGKKVPFSCEPLSRRSQSIHFSFSFFFWLFRKNV